MLKNVSAGLAGLLLLTACASQTSHTAYQWDDRLQRGTLTNGMEYWLLPTPGVKGQVDMRLTVRAGSVDEKPGQIGVAHMVEHLSFYQRGSFPGTVRQSLLAAGWKQGQHFNAVTSNDRTQYFFSPSGGNTQLELGLQALATLSGPVDFTAADLQQERPIVLEEWRGGLGVAQRMNEQRREAQRVGSRYVSHPPIGSEAGILTAPLDSLKDFHETWYKPGNMRLVITGDIDPKTLPNRIDYWFGSQPASATPNRDYLELPLDHQLKIIQLQDSQSGGSNVALMFRFHEKASSESSPEGMRQRLINRLLLSLTQQQLRNQATVATRGVNSLTVQKHQIGDESVVLALAASVDANGHERGLQRVLEEMTRLRQHGFDPVLLEAEKAKLRDTALNMLKKGDDREFTDWVRRLNDATLQQQTVMRSSVLATLSLELLDEITVADLNQRWNDWTANADRIVQYQAPGLTPIKLATPEHVQLSLKHWQQQDLAAALPIVKLTVELPTLPAPAQAGTVISQKRFDAEQVEQWQLSNGDRLVWLKRSGADGKAQLQIDSAAGYLAEGLSIWQSQAAAQLVEQSGPKGWSPEQQKLWRSTHGVELSTDLEAQRMSVSGHSSVAELAQLLGLYQQWQTQPQIDTNAFDNYRKTIADSLARQPDHVGQKVDQARADLYYGALPNFLPNATQVASVGAEQLLNQWQTMSKSPVTYYLMADIDAEQLKTLVGSHLAGIPRGAALSARPLKRLSGTQRQNLAVGLEPRINLSSVSFSEHRWSPNDAATVSTLNKLAQEDLKAQLRGEASGVYRLTFETELSQDQQRIESRLLFTTDPRRQDELWKLSQQVLTSLPQRIDEQRLEPLRKQFLAQEKLRLSDPQTQMRRLILSDRAYADPRYLSQQGELKDALQVDALKAMAKQLWNPANVRQLRVSQAAEADK